MIRSCRGLIPPTSKFLYVCAYDPDGWAQRHKGYTNSDTARGPTSSLGECSICPRGLVVGVQAEVERGRRSQVFECGGELEVILCKVTMCVLLLGVSYAFLPCCSSALFTVPTSPFIVQEGPIYKS
jgi:hypothetical protein